MKHNQKEIKVFTLKEDARAKFDSFVNKFSFNPYDNPEMAMQLMGRKLEELFPEELLKTLNVMGKTGNPEIILIKNFPIDVIVPKGKSVKDRADLKGNTSEAAILGTVSLMGYKLHSNPKEQEGRIIHNISPVSGYEATKSSKGRDPFYLHIENPFEQSPPDFLILASLEGDTCAKTTYFFIDGFIKGLPEWVLEGMKKPEFEIRSGAGFDEVESGIFSLITKEDTGRLRLRLYQSDERIKPLTPNARKVMEYLVNEFKDIEAHDEIRGIGLEPGETIIFNNGWGLNQVTGMMHGRGGYIENPGRWLQRGFLYQQQETDVAKIAEGYFQSVSLAMTDYKNFSIKDAAGVLRKAMLRSEGCKAYREANPEATDAQLALYGTNTNGSGNWLQRITKESVVNSYNASKSM